MTIKKKLVIPSAYEEIEKVEHLLNDLQAEINFDDEFYARLMLTVSEAATNAAVHGNELDPKNRVLISAEYDGNTLTISTKDQGNGFKPNEVANPLDEENLLKPSGRGVFLMREYADEVSYEENSTLLVLTFHL